MCRISLQATCVMGVLNSINTKEVLYEKKQSLMFSQTSQANINKSKWEFYFSKKLARII